MQSDNLIVIGIDVDRARVAPAAHTGKRRDGRHAKLVDKNGAVGSRGG